mgnify:FL=1|jgi:hypothetical protein|nr:MAG TPA: protein of unknown function (DUF5320) [Caudoviricetes sp.]
MSIKENVSIPIFNYNESNICIPTNVSTHILPPAIDGVPSVDYLSFAEINYVNGISDCFRTGLVRFDDNDKEEIYRTLNIANWENILTNNEIKEILLNPTIEGLQKIIDITNVSIFDRVKTIFVSLKENTDNDISNRVIKIMETREQEFKRGIYKSQIVLKPKDVPEKTVSNDEINAIKEQNTMLMEQLAEMQKMIASLKTNKVETDVPEIKKAGRPSTKNK